MNDMRDLYEAVSKDNPWGRSGNTLPEERGEGKGKGGPAQRNGGADYCLCIGCGYSKKHSRGEPCNANSCPKCGGPLIGASAAEIEELKSKYSQTEAKKTKAQTRGKCVFQSSHAKVTDDKDHFPINSVKQARNALARAGQYNKSPSWYKGSLSQLQKTIQNAVKKAYPSIEVTEKVQTDIVEITRQCLDCGKVYDSVEKNCPECKSNNTEVIFDESKVVEQEYKTIAKGIEDEEAAKKIASDKKGTVIQDEDDEKKFAVVVKEAFLDLDADDSADLFIARVDVDGSNNLITNKTDITYMLDVDYKGWGIESIRPVFTQPVLITYEGSEGGSSEIEVDLSDVDIDWVAGKDYSPNMLSIQIVNDRVVETSITFNYYVP